MKENMASYIKESFNEDKVREELNKEGSNFFFLLFIEDKLSGYLKLNEEEAQTDIKDPKALETDEKNFIKSLHSYIEVKANLSGLSLNISFRKEFIYINIYGD